MSAQDDESAVLGAGTNVDLPDVRFDIKKRVTRVWPAEDGGEPRVQQLRCPFKVERCHRDCLGFWEKGGMNQVSGERVQMVGCEIARMHIGRLPENDGD